MSSTSPRASFDSTTTTGSTKKHSIVEGASTKKSSSVTAKVRSAFGKLKPQTSTEGEASEGGKAPEVPKSVKEGSFGGESSHLRMQM